MRQIDQKKINNQRSILINILLLLLSPLSVCGFALVHHLYVLNIPFESINPIMFLIPIIVGVIFGYLLTWLRIMKRQGEIQLDRLRKQEFNLVQMNKKLEKRIAHRTRKLSETLGLTQNILDSTDNIVLLTDGLQTYQANQAFFRFFSGFKSLEEFNLKHGSICDFFESSLDEQCIDKYINEKLWVKFIANHQDGSFRATVKYNNKHRIFEIKSRSLIIKDKTYYVATLSDVTDLISYEKKLEASAEKLWYQLYFDSLTGLPNRTKLLKDIWLYHNPGLLLLDIDSFKQINNYFSHNAGDLILKKVAEEIGNIINFEKEILYRLSGDEYAILFRNSNGSLDLKKKTELIVKAISAMGIVVSGETEIIINISMGIVEPGYVSKDQLMSSADIALKSAKLKHKNREFFDYSLLAKKETESNLRIIKLLNSAIKENQIFFHIQPILNNSSKAIEKYECLARINDSNGNLILPGEFIHTAKTAKLYPFITCQVLEKACETFKDTEFEFSINISIKDILNKETVKFIYDIIKKFDLGSRLVFEILESEGMEELAEVKYFVNTVKQSGCKIAIDDFGSGYSNFDHILKLDVDYLKIDSTLIKNISTDENSFLIVQTIQNFTEKIGIKTVGEHIHSEEVFEKVIQIGLNYSQGYFIGKPEPANFAS